MGAHDCLTVFKTDSEAKVRKGWALMQEDAAEEDGHGSYSGTCATMRGKPRFHDKKLAGEDAARDFVLENHDKWDAAIAVSFYLAAKPGQRKIAAIKRANDKLNSACNALAALKVTLTDDLLNRKSAFISCRKCLSKLSREHLSASRGRSHSECPLCYGSLLSATALKRIATAEAKSNQLREARNEAHKDEPSKKLGWLVGGWAAS
jgi:hypothetical protein